LHAKAKAEAGYHRFYALYDKIGREAQAAVATTR
jgi:hypothetical protein